MPRKRIESSCSTVFPSFSVPSHSPIPRLFYPSAQPTVLPRCRPTSYNFLMCVPSQVVPSDSWETALSCCCCLAILLSMFLLKPSRVPHIHSPGFEMGSVATEHFLYPFTFPSLVPFPETPTSYKPPTLVHKHRTCLRARLCASSYTSA